MEILSSLDKFPRLTILLRLLRLVCPSERRSVRLAFHCGRNDLIEIPGPSVAQWQLSNWTCTFLVEKYHVLLISMVTMGHIVKIQAETPLEFLVCHAVTVHGSYTRNFKPALQAKRKTKP